MAKKKEKAPELTQEQIQKLLQDAGYEVVVPKHTIKIVNTKKDLNTGDTLFFPEGRSKGVKVKV